MHGFSNISAVAIALATLIAADAYSRADAPSTQPSYYENVIQLVGQEEDGHWSLRLADTAFRERATFHLSSLWIYRPAEKKWEIVDKPGITHMIVPPKDKVPDGPEDSQILADVPEIKTTSRGLYYARWEVDGTPGATFIRLGSASATAHSDDEKKPVPPGMIATVVPIDDTHAAFTIIPDPKVACVEP